jgi:hypothetical protein
MKSSSRALIAAPLAGALAVVVLGAALVGAARLPSATDEAKATFAANVSRWAHFTDSQRNELRLRWREWLARPAEQRALAERRYAVLCRLRQRLASPVAGAPTDDRIAAELRGQLEGLTLQLRREAPDAPTDIGLPDAVDVLFRVRAQAFLDHLQARGHLTREELAPLLALSTPALADKCLGLLKAEHLALLDEDDAEALAEADPRDVAARVDALRREHGFLGNAASELWPLTPEERAVLAALPTAARVQQSLREMKAPAVRDHLQARQMPPEAVELLLAQPWDEVERSLEELLAAG